MLDLPLKRSFYFLGCKFPRFSWPSNHQHKGKRHNLRSICFIPITTRDESNIKIHMQIIRTYKNSVFTSVWVDQDWWPFENVALLSLGHALEFLKPGNVHSQGINSAHGYHNSEKHHAGLLYSGQIQPWSWQSGFTDPAMANTRTSDSGTSVQCPMNMTL